jgi:PiT family inorganic phosphate transporter
MATSIATGALPPRVAVALSGLLNLVGAFLSLAVAATIASGLAGGSAVQWKGLTSKVIIPAALSPIIAALVAALGTWLLYRISRSLTRGARNHGFRIGQVGSACMVSLAHGTNDAQKTMGVITLALIANGTLPTGAQAPFWVILSCALAISIGTYLGGWRVIRTLGKGLVEIESPQGMAAESSSAAIILLSASFGYSLSTTHVATGSIIGTGLGKKGADVRWNVAGRMATAWLFTLPSAGVAGALAYWLAHGIGGSVGVIILLAILTGLSLAIYLRSRATKVDHNNVNDEWTGGAPSEPEPAAAV